MDAKKLGAILPSFPYPKPGHGYWLPVTSTLNWCEEDYYATIYSAEIVNTLTNLLFILLAAKGFWNCLHHKHDRIFLISFTGYMCVGIGSFLFHATLKYPMQLVDELSMIYTACFSCYASFSYGKSRVYSICVAVFLVALAIFITAYYHYLQDPSFHQNMYGLLTITIIVRSMIIMELNLRPRFTRKRKIHDKQQRKGEVNDAEKREQMRQDRRDKYILQQMWAMVGYGLAIFIGGYGLWNIDNIYCSTLSRWRKEIGLPWGLLLEGHGWWHIMTGIGAYFYIMWGIWLRHILNQRQDEYELIWDTRFPNIFFSLPVVALKKPMHIEMITGNGVAKKTM